MHSVIQPNQYVALRLPSDQVRVEQVVPNTIISAGRYGTFQADQILGRPFHLVFEILDRVEVHNSVELRIVPPAEVHADALIQQEEASTNSNSGAADGESQGQNTLWDGRTNQSIVDDSTNQRLTMAEIEALKSNADGSSKEVIAKILGSHSMIDQKTAFSLAKYTLRKTRKYLKRFSVLPIDMPILTDWLMNERDFGKVMEIRNEILGLIGCWANVHHGGGLHLEVQPASQYLMVDDTGGLLVAAMAERMGILYTDGHRPHRPEGHQFTSGEQGFASPEQLPSGHRHVQAMSSQSNTITLLHSNSQPNLALLKYFSFDVNTPPIDHPLYTHLKTLSWLQLISPSSDPAYVEPEVVPSETLATWKSSRRSAYYRKRRRWIRTKSVIDGTRQGGFHGLVLATLISPASIFHHVVPLLVGGAQVVVYSPHVEPLAKLADLYSTARRVAFISTPEEQRAVPSDDFPLDPTLLLAPSVQTARMQRWQVLPGRTHPLMTGRGGAEGYIFVATKVLPAPGKVEARGRTGEKRRKLERPSDPPVISAATF